MKIKDSIDRWSGILSGLKKHDSKFDQIVKNFGTFSNHNYQNLIVPSSYKTQFRQKEFQVYSQNGEDGLILHIFDQIGITDGRFIEFGIGDGKQCNTANLSLNFNWSGLLLEGDPSQVDRARKYYTTNGCQSDKVKIEQLFITKDNINQKFIDAGFTGTIDLLSIDIDGNDYWIWECIEVVSPRVIILEYNASLGGQQSVTIPYDNSFAKYDHHPDGWYHGASVSALEKLGKSKGYVLVGCDSSGVNMFFVKETEMKGSLQVISAKESFYSQRKRCLKMTQEKQELLMRQFVWETI